MPRDDVTAWIDLVSPSHPFFFKSLVDSMSELVVRTTVRRKTETVDLAASAGFDFTVLGRDFGNPVLRKIGIPLRTLQLVLQAPAADISLSSRNAMCVLASNARGIPSIHFTDNDITAHVDGLAVEKLYNRFEAMATYNVVPEAFDSTELTRWGASTDQIVTYPGYKEDIYVAAFEPDPGFTQQLPFEEFITVRPEALNAAYVDVEESIVPELLAEVVDRGYNVVYLPRGRGDEEYAAPYANDRVYVPETALDGLQLAWHGHCMLTGSGTMAREAASMEKPSVSFFPNTPLSVDQKLINNGRIFHSRDVDAILDYIAASSRETNTGDLERSIDVRSKVTALLGDLITNELHPCVTKAT